MVKPSARTIRWGLLTFALAIATALSLRQTVRSYQEDVRDAAAATDSVSVSGPEKQGALAPSTEVRLAYGPGMEELGWLTIQHSRPCGPGMLDVTDLAPEQRLVHEVLNDPVCGVIWEREQHNALTHTGAYRVLQCFLSNTSCPGAANEELALDTAGTYLRTSTSASFTELASGSHPTYARKTLSSWTCSSNAGSANNCATGNQTWSSVSTDWPALTGLRILVGTDTLAYSAFSRDLASGDSLTVSYTLTFQSSAD